MIKLPTLTEDPEHQDSEDLADAEIATAIRTETVEDWVRILVPWSSRGYTIVSQEHLRRGDNLFIRTTLQNGDVKKALVAYTNWLGSGT